LSSDEVLAKLDELVERSRRSESPLGYFPALYRKVTLRVQQRIAAGEFDDADRMEALLTTFADRYFEARAQFESGDRPTEAWRVCFEAADDSSLIVLQHLLLGMNAHINLDLGIAAATVAEGDDLGLLRRDFDRINDVLESLVNDVNADLTQVWPPLRFLNLIGRRSSGRLTDFSMRRARDHAWALAEDLHGRPSDERSRIIDTSDAVAAALARLVTDLPARTKLLLRAIRFGERGTIRDRIDRLSD
jgi:hypothetical protein